MLALHTLRSFRSTLAAASVVGAVAGAVVPALATDLGPNQTLDPVPIVSLPAGAVLQQTITQDYDISWTVIPNPIPRHITGTVTQSIYRLADNTLTFTYRVTNDATSQGGLEFVGVRDFSDATLFDTDVSLRGGIICLNCEDADRARRDLFGSGITFEYDLGIPTDSQTRTLVIRTNATSYSVSSCRGLYSFGSGRVVVGNSARSVTLCGFASPVTDSTPPIVSITGPTALANNCNPVTIVGTAYDPQGFDNYVVEYSANPNGPWTQIASSTSDVNPAGTLAMWNTTSIASGYYFVRLTGENSTGMTSSVTSVIYVDRTGPNTDLRSPASTNILGGTVCFDGTVWDTGGSTYTIRYRSLPSGSFSHVNPATPSYAGQIINDGLGSWNTRTGPTAVPDGTYQVRLEGIDTCGLTTVETADIIVDNTAPVAFISSPAPCTTVNGTISITGRATDANLASWTLQYTGGDLTTWQTIASGTGPIDGTFAQWNTERLRACAYTLRLIAGDRAAVNCGSTNNHTEYTVSVFVGCDADFNHDNFINSQDYFDFLTAFFAPCP